MLFHKSVLLVLCFTKIFCEGIIFPQDSRENSINLSKEQFPFESENFIDEENQKELKEGDVRWKGWNYLDTKKEWTPHEKTISLQFLDDDGKYTHSPPRWPHDEYFLQFPNPNFHNGVRNETESASSGSESINEPNETNKDYEWQKLRPQSPTSMFIGPGFYDYGSSSNQYVHNYPQYSHQAITDGTSSTVITKGEGQIPGTASESTNNGKFYPGGGGYPDDYYRRKRLRLKIHPGLIAAPIAGFAAYKAVSAIAGKPLLFELGWVNNKPNIDIGGGGWGFNQQPYYPPVLPLPNQPYPPIGYPTYPNYVPVAFAPGGGNQAPLVPKYPILIPKKRPSSQKSAWWNPFAALTPRFRMKKDEENDEGEISNREFDREN